MPCVHEFAIIDEFDKQKSYLDYESHKFNCILVDDEIIDSLMDHLSIMKTYFHSFKRPEYGLARWGITIIPPESLSLFYDVIASSKLFSKSPELNELASKIIQAQEESKYMIHYGI